MQFIRISFIIILVVYTVFTLHFAYKNGKMLKTLLFSALIGVLTFTVINLLSGLTNVGLPVNGWTVSSSAVFGIPGVLGLLIMRIII